MPRSKRIVLPGYPHHVTQRGNYQQIVFDKPEDYRRYCYWYQEYASKYQVTTVAYCLMPNHFHFIVIPQEKDGLGDLFRTVNMLYSQYKHRQRGVVGQLWQGRFYSCILDDFHLYHAIRYVEANPVKARLAFHPSDYIWSSARQHLNLEASPIIVTQLPLDLRQRVASWDQYLKSDDDSVVDYIRQQTCRNLVAGKRVFIDDLEKKLNIKLKGKLG